MNLEYIKNKLLNYGINLENYLYQTGNLIGKLNVPNQLLSYNKNMTPEEAFYLVANKVFELANLLAYNIPISLNEDYKNVVGPDIYRDFQKAIYEEINQRFLSNAFPEFSNAGQMSLSNTNFNSGIIGGPSLMEWTNPMSKQIIANIPWRDFYNKAEILKYKAYMYRNMENATFPNSHEKRVLQVLEDGSVGLENKNFFATSNNLDLANNEINLIRSNQNINTNDINNIKAQLPHLASVKYVNELITKFPKTKKYDPDKEYSHGDFVVFFKKIYFSLNDHNLNNTPGGITGEGWWEEIADIFIPQQETSIIYAAGTDIKQSFTNPNEMYYIDINEILSIENLNLEKLFQFLSNKFSYLNLTTQEVEKFFNNLCNSDELILKELFQKQIFKKGQILFFDNIQNLHLFLQKHKISETHFSKFESGRFLKIGDQELIGGQEFINENNISLKEWSFSLKSMHLFGHRTNNISPAKDTIALASALNDSADGEGLTKTSSGWNNVNINYINAKLSNSSYGRMSSWNRNDIANFSLNDYLNGTEFSWNFGTSSPKKFEPLFKEIVAIKLTEDIYETLIKYFVNVIDLTISGTIKKTQNTHQTNYSQNNEKNIISETNKNRKRFK